MEDIMRQAFYNSYWKPKGFGSPKAKYKWISVPCLPNTGLTSGHRFYIVGATVGEVKKCFRNYKKIRRDSYGRVEVIHTANGSGPRPYWTGPKQIKDLPKGAYTVWY